jgi:hypothetical protein
MRHHGAIASAVLRPADDRSVTVVVAEIPRRAGRDELAASPAAHGARRDLRRDALPLASVQRVVAALGRARTRRTTRPLLRIVRHCYASPGRVREVEPAGVEPASDQAVQECRLPAFRAACAASTRAPSFPARVSPSLRTVRRVGAVTRRPGRSSSRMPRALRARRRRTRPSRNDRSRSHLRLPVWASTVGRDPLEHCCRCRAVETERPHV